MKKVRIKEQSTELPTVGGKNYAVLKKTNLMLPMKLIILLILFLVILASNSANGTFFSTIKTTGKPTEIGDEIEYPASLDSILFQQMVATPTRIHSTYYW